MKYLLVVLVVSMSTVANAVTTDSLFGPFHLPFDLRVTLTGSGVRELQGMSFQDTETYRDTIHVASGAGTFEMRGDTNVLKAVMSGGQMPDPYTTNKEIMLVVDTNLKRIKYLEISSGSSWVNARRSALIALSDLTYDATGISMADTNLVAKADHFHISYYYNHDQGQLDNESIELSTLVQATLVLVAAPALSVTSSIAKDNFTVISSNGAFRCYFPVRSEPQQIEVYSLLGQRLLVRSIAAGEEQATFSLPKGLYFVRLGGTTLKVFNER